MHPEFKRLFSLSKRGIILGTASTRALLNALGSPDKKLKIIHVAGTDGKGSISRYIYEILLAAKKCVGLFTSPAVLRPTEAFDFCGREMTEEELAPYLKAALDKADGNTEFEVQTACAILAFAQKNAEYAVLECGMGGLYDATNAVEDKLISLIGTIGLEHTAYLGGTIEQICAHKAGIIKGKPAVICALQPKEAIDYFNKYIPTAVFADKSLKILNSDKFGTEFLYDGRKYETLLAGNAQPYNAAAAIEAAHILGIEEEAIFEGISRAKLTARLQLIKKGERDFVLDGAHNPPAIKNLAEYLSLFESDKTEIIFGSLSDKDIDKNLSYLCGKADKITAVEPKSGRAMPIEVTLSACKKYFKKAQKAESVKSALENSAYKNVVVCGTFTIIKEALDWIGRE